ncbi:hypothetical protein IWZ03DRAFT_403715 [Phyllosticta citriasiana]|uniref:DUF4038 domain-containing protein n=1 Tax=Phyllosticta citriasiana TaxID=595635 RepID=A0ABR1L160_9PEZI
MPQDANLSFPSFPDKLPAATRPDLVRVAGAARAQRVDASLRVQSRNNEVQTKQFPEKRYHEEKETLIGNKSHALLKPKLSPSPPTLGQPAILDASDVGHPFHPLRSADCHQASQKAVRIFDGAAAPDTSCGDRPSETKFGHSAAVNHLTTHAFLACLCAGAFLKRPGESDLVFDNGDPTTPNAGNFSFVDWVTTCAAEYGILICFVPTWGRYVSRGWYGTEGLVLFNESNAEVFGYFLGKRYPDIPKMMGGDTNGFGADNVPHGGRIGLRTQTPGLLTHSCPGPMVIEMRSQFAGPVMDVKSHYEPANIAFNDSKPLWNASHVRHGFYSARSFERLSGIASPAHCNEPQLSLSPNASWHEGLHVPSAKQTGFVWKLFSSLPRSLSDALEPAKHLVSSPPAGQSVDILGFVQDRYVWGEPAGVLVDAWWFDPRTAERKAAVEEAAFAAQGKKTFTPPTSGGVDDDWVLEIKATSACW